MIKLPKEKRFMAGQSFSVRKSQLPMLENEYK